MTGEQDSRQEDTRKTAKQRSNLVRICTLLGLQWWPIAVVALAMFTDESMPFYSIQKSSYVHHCNHDWRTEDPKDVVEEEARQQDDPCGDGPQGQVLNPLD